MERVLLRFTKGEPVRFVGHLDLMRVFDRAMRRSDFPVAYSQGFNPRPRMAFASALTLGATSDWELCQLDLAEDLTPERFHSALEAFRMQLPPGITVPESWAIPLDKKNPFIQVYAAAYELTLTGEDVVTRVRQFFEQGPGLPQALESAWKAGLNDVGLKVKLPVGGRQSIRIRDLVAELEAALPGIRVTRLHRARLWCEQEPAPLQPADNGRYGEAS